MGSSSRGPTRDGRDKPDIVAPGTAIIIECSTGGYELRAGTSFSAALVSGVIALLRENTSDPQRVKKALTDTAMKIKDPYTKGDYPNNIQGHGLINAQSAYPLL